MLISLRHLEPNREQLIKPEVYAVACLVDSRRVKKTSVCPSTVGAKKCTVMVRVQERKVILRCIGLGLTLGQTSWMLLARSRVVLPLLRASSRAYAAKADGPNHAILEMLKSSR